MPKEHKRLYTVGDFWLVPPDQKYPDFGISWYDKPARQTRRVGTECTDFEDAKTAINKHALEHGDGAHKDELLLQTVNRYYLCYGKSVAGYKTILDTIKFVSKYCVDDAGEPTYVSKFDATQQRKLVTGLREHGLSDSSISNHLVFIFAALGYAHQFSHLPEKVIPKRLSKRFWGDRTQPRKRKPAAGKRALTLQEWGRLFDAAIELGEHSLRYLICQVGTIGRPGAVAELTGQQIDLKHGIVDLNPPGRAQTKKRRPKVRICDTFRLWLELWSVPPEQHCMLRRGRPLCGGRFVWAIIRKARIPDCNPYTLRHSVSSWLAWKGVDKWERKKAMGHAKVDGGSTDDYTHYEPEYLRAVADALEELFQGIAQNTRFNLLHRVIEDQGPPEALWQGVPQVFIGRSAHTHLISPETFNEVQEARPEFRSGGALSVSNEIAMGGLREAVEPENALYRQRMGNQLHPLSAGDASRPTSRTAQTEDAATSTITRQPAAASRPSDPPFVGSCSIELPTVSLNFHTGAWQVRGGTTLGALSDQVLDRCVLHLS